MIGITRFIFGCDPDGPFSSNGAFMFTDAATNAPFRVDKRLLKPDQNVNIVSRRRGWFPGSLRGDRQAAGRIFYNQTRLLIRLSIYQTKIITCSQPASGKRVCVEFDKMVVGRFDNERCSHMNRIELFTGENRLGAYRTVFLAHDARYVHGPWQAAPPVYKGGAYFNRATGCKLILSQALTQADGPDGSRRAHISAGDAFVLATAGTDTEIENRCPQALKPAHQTRRMNDIGRTDSHALAAFDATGKKFFLPQATGRANKARVPIGAKVTVQAQHGNRGCTG